MTSRIDKDKLYEYCSIPVDQLENHPDARIKIKIFDRNDQTMEYCGNMMADEVIANNKAGKMTRWVLPAGPSEQFEYFIDRVNTEEISLKNVHVCLMDDVLDWNCRPFPLDHPYFNNEGRMNKIFYGKIHPKLNIPPEQRHVPRYNDLDAMDETIEKLGGLDTVYGGMGFTGLVAYCEAPRSPWTTISEDEYCQMKTRIFPINDDTIIAGAERRFGGLTHIMPSLSISIGFKSLLNTKRVILVSTTGAWKRTAIRVLMFCEPTVEYPATLFTDKVDEVILLTDRNTAAPPIPTISA
jgi:glucosamine-6-phosphate deaminase